jgi:hypothetical protein
MMFSQMSDFTSPMFKRVRHFTIFTLDRTMTGCSF